MPISDRMAVGIPVRLSRDSVVHGESISQGQDSKTALSEKKATRIHTL